MKLLDTKEGKLIGINVIDLIVAAVVLFLIFSLGTKVMAKPLTFSGEQMYTAITAYKKLESKGFLIGVNVEGKWIANEEPFLGKGLLTDTKAGAFKFKSEDGSVLWIGGSMGYLEDIAASKIEFRPLDEYVAAYELKPMSFSTYEDFLGHFAEFSKNLKVEHLLLSLDISFTNPSKTAQELSNEFGRMYLLQYYSLLPGRESEVIFRLRLAELSELQKLNVSAAKVVIGGEERKVFAGFKKEPDKNLLAIKGRYVLASLRELR